MRGAVVGAAVLMAAAIAGMGALAWTALSGPSAKAREGMRLRRSDDRAANRPDRPGKPHGARAAPTIDEPASAPAAPRIAAEDRGDPSGPQAPNDPGDPCGGGPRPGVPGAGQPGGGVDPGLPIGPVAGSPGGAAVGVPRGLFPPAPPAAAGSACPARMVDVGSFCIDATEVTNVAYGAFLGAKPNGRLQPAACTWNLDYMPAGGPPASDVRPVVGVDWCDAWLYCAWSGKRMCGHLGNGGNNATSAFADASMSEWYDVCTNGNVSRFSYGDTFDGSKCAHAGDDGSTLAHVSAMPSCVGTTPPYDAVFDMSGNAGEWEDSCAGEQGGGDLCRVRGDGQHGSSAEVSCAADHLARREQTFKTVGFRCCAGRRPGL